MVALIEFTFAILNALLTIAVWLVIADVIVSWLVQFDVINMRNRVIRNVVNFLDAITHPILRPLRRIIPPLGGIDISPMLLIIVIGAAQQYLLPALENWLISLVI
ncbi:MAG TPA: YggT family protein [Caulobacteraceae bacterium]|jgi:YggT family protein